MSIISVIVLKMAGSSAVFKYIVYFQIPQNAERNFNARCKTCSKMYSASTGATSNLLTHLKVHELLLSVQLVKPTQCIHVSHGIMFTI